MDGGWAEREGGRAGESSTGLGARGWALCGDHCTELHWLRDRQGGQALQIKGKAKGKPSSESTSPSGCPSPTLPPQLM